MKIAARNIVSGLVFCVLIVVFVYLGMVASKSYLIKKLESTKIENVKTNFENDALHISFDIKDTHPNAAMYIFVRDEKGEPYYDPTIINTFPFRHPFSDEFMKIHNGKNMATIDVANFSSQNVYLIMYIKPYGDVAIARWSSPKSLSCLEISPAPFAVGCA